MSTYTHLAYHCIFATKGRRPFLTTEIRHRVHEYLGGTVRGLNGIALGVNGVEDHVHMLFVARPDKSVSDLMRVVKSQSSRWIHETFETHGDFEWQSGYAAFGVSLSRIESVQAYIARQEEHHRKVSFRDELVAFLKEHGIEYDERYLE